MSAPKRPGMQLPPHDRAGGEILGAHWTDARVPAPLRRRLDEYTSEQQEPRVVGYHLRDEHCPDGRHLFDIIESLIEHELEEGNDEAGWTYRLEHEFSARLTCVRCGVVLAWKGTRDADEFAGTVTPAPLVAGDMVAQETSAHRSIGGRDMSTWTVYRDGAQVGLVSWARGQRGRAFHVGRLDAWPAGEKVEGADPAATLRKVARLDQQLRARTPGSASDGATDGTGR